MSQFSDLLKTPLSWEIELTSRCNSRCVGCSRYSEYYYPNPYFNSRMDLSIDTLKKALAETSTIDFILFCGNYGDPLLHPQIFEILAHLQDKYPQTRVLTHSNASFGKPEFWAQLADYFKKPGSYLYFSIDGLQQSHEKFRRGTNWENIIQNASKFIDAGGRAVWKMIQFDHNHTEIEEARLLSEKIGFRKFDLRQNNYPGLGSAIAENPPLNLVPLTVNDDKRTSPSLTNWNLSQAREKRFDTIECRSLVKKNMYLDVHGNVWPCCWVGGLPYRPEHELRQWFQENLIGHYEPGFNSLATNSLKDIFSHPWLQSHLPQSWQNPADAEQNPLISTCAKTCGKCLS